MNWYVKCSDGKVFGPADDNKILEWVKDGRVDPFAGVSNNLKNWKLASLEPAFEMDWIVEIEPGRFYGPTHWDVIENLFKSNSVSSSCRIYRDYHDGVAEKEAAAARADAEKAMAEVRMMSEVQAEAEKAMAEVQAEAEKAMAELKNEAERAISAKDTEILALKEGIANLKSLAEQKGARVKELEHKIESLIATKQREWQVDVVDPEIMTGEAPPPVREVFNPGKNLMLADLERQAQAELARMGAAGAKRFFGLKE
jgi:hypothetical protein